MNSWWNWRLRRAVFRCTRRFPVSETRSSKTNYSYEHCHRACGTWHRCIWTCVTINYGYNYSLIKVIQWSWSFGHMHCINCKLNIWRSWWPSFFSELYVNMRYYEIRRLLTLGLTRHALSYPLLSKTPRTTATTSVRISRVYGVRNIFDHYR